MTAPNLDQKKLWKAIYEQEGVASRMAELAARQEDGSTFELPPYGTVKLVVNAASSLGDSFMSDTYYNTATLGDGDSYKAFVKVLPSNPLMRTEAVKCNLYDREMASYGSFHPSLRQLWNERRQTEADFPLRLPDIYHTHLETSQGGGCPDVGGSTVLVMEDLSWQGFRMVDKHQGCSREESLLILSALASFHALNHAWLRKHREADGSHSLPPSSGHVLHRVDFKDTILSILTNTVPIYSEMMRLLGHAELAVWLQEQMKYADDVFTARDISNCGPLACICHGDCWSNNFLIHYDGAGDADDASIIDWQMLLPDNPGRDVYEFLTSSTTPELRKECGREFLEHYVDTFMSVLRQLGVRLEDEGLDRDSVMAEIEKRRMYGLLMGLVLLPSVIDDTMTSKLDEMSRDLHAVEARGADPGHTCDVFAEAQNSLTLDGVMANEMLCHRIIGLVEEFRQVLQ